MAFVEDIAFNYTILIHSYFDLQEVINIKAIISYSVNLGSFIMYLSVNLMEDCLVFYGAIILFIYVLF
jgi:hypothetical protein